MTTVKQAIAVGERAAVRVVLASLHRHLGLIKTARVLGRVAVARVRGEPFKRLGPAEGERDQLSRRQCGDLVLLDRAVTEVADAQVAMAVAREAVLAGAVPFLDAMLPAMDETALRQLAPRLVKSFFNAEGRGEPTSDGGYAFDVTRCRFVELLGAVGASHLGPLFCEADTLFFDGKRRPLVLHRSKTIAGGGDTCDFRFKPVAP